MAQQFRQYLPDEINSENLAYYYDLVSSAHGSFYRLKQTIPQNDGVLPLLPPSFWAIQLTQGGQQTSHVQQEQEEQEEEEEEEEDEEEGDSTQPIAQPTQSAIQPVTELQQTTPTTSESLRSDVRVVNAVRLVTHALPQNTEWNHWSIYLVLTGGGSVRFHMTTVANSNKGAFSVSPALSYTLTNSAIRHWDFSVVANLTVGHVFTLIIDEGLQKYEMTGDGSGCRFWVSVVVQKLEENLYIITGSKDTAWAALQYFYRMNDHGEITTRQLEMVYGEFYE